MQDGKKKCFVLPKTCFKPKLCIFRTQYLRQQTNSHIKMESVKRDLMNVCRVCFVEATTMQTLFQQCYLIDATAAAPEKNMSDMFTACTEIVLRPHEHCPHLICTDCSLKLISAYEFRMKSVEAEKEIRTILGGGSQQQQQQLQQHGSAVNSTAMAKCIKLESDPMSTGTPSPVDIESLEPKVELKAEDNFIEYSLVNHLHDYPDDDGDDDDDELSDDSEYVPAPTDPYKVSKLKRSPTESDAKLFACNECDQKFLKKRSLSAHQRAHKREWENEQPGEMPYREFPCTECKQVFNRKRSLSAHLRAHNRESGRKYNCESCFEPFVNYSLLKKHMRTHNTGQTFECDICQGKYKFRSRLIHHMDSHREKTDQSYDCSYCDKSEYLVGRQRGGGGCGETYFKHVFPIRIKTRIPEIGRFAQPSSATYRRTTVSVFRVRQGIPQQQQFASAHDSAQR